MLTVPPINELSCNDFRENVKMSFAENENQRWLMVGLRKEQEKVRECFKDELFSSLVWHIYIIVMFKCS